MFFMVLIAMIFLLEYGIKCHMDRVRTLQQRRPFAGGKIVLKKYYNKGAAGNFLNHHPKSVCYIHTSALLLVFVAWIYMLPQKNAAVAKTGLSFLAGGGASNLYDRLTRGHVIDYISFGFGPKKFQKLVFNTADFFVFAGIFLCMIQMIKKEG